MTEVVVVMYEVMYVSVVMMLVLVSHGVLVVWVSVTGMVIVVVIGG